ncbi:MAG TPA: 50S ribosomal protein L22 [Atribacterota bacterium]|nr:50S ribosomal protein L22 [Atribacterota bacterium]HOR41680.1 50S ribosomal protein L22 [Atribacterota bacterium]HPK86647.1 50S ribosomal protein L22 [Atribacterota bacterium]
MGVKSVGKYLPISPRKCRRMTELIRGKDAGSALLILQFSPKKSAKMVYKVLKSAIANAENNHDKNVDKLYVNKVFVDEGPTLKRFRPRAMGRAAKINKRTSHITIEVQEKGVEV